MARQYKKRSSLCFTDSEVCKLAGLSHGHFINALYGSHGRKITPQLVKRFIDAFKILSEQKIKELEKLLSQIENKNHATN